MRKQIHFQHERLYTLIKSELEFRACSSRFPFFSFWGEKKNQRTKKQALPSELCVSGDAGTHLVPLCAAAAIRKTVPMKKSLD